MDMEGRWKEIFKDLEKWMEKENLFITMVKNILGSNVANFSGRVERYIGNWLNWKQHGKSVLIGPNGEKIEGE